jgi:NAD(P)-dependent dehydrogenase (short-subunit alcohol dehydrogenase family)
VPHSQSNDFHHLRRAIIGVNDAGGQLDKDTLHSAWQAPTRNDCIVISQLICSATIGGMDLSGTVAVVTGGSGILGGGIARAFAAAGAAVVVHYRKSAERATSVVGDIVAEGGQALPAQCDVTDPGGCAGLMATAIEAFGRLDTVVANAGVQPVAELARLSVPQWRAVVDTNLLGSFATAQAAASVMGERGGGAIILIGSTEGTQPAWSHAHYCASKAAVIHFARVAALEYGRQGIRVNSVSPGLIWRDGLDLDWPDGVARFRRAAPLGRLGRPADIGNACVFLASSMAEWITGQDLVVDGGVSVHPTW